MMIEEKEKQIFVNPVGHRLSCGKCGDNIERISRHTDVRTIQEYILCVCIKCSVEILKETGHFIFNDNPIRKNLDFLEKLEMVRL